MSLPPWQFFGLTLTKERLAGQESHRWHTAPHSDDLIVIIASVEPAALQREASGGEPCSAADVRYDSFGGLSLSKLVKW